MYLFIYIYVYIYMYIYIYICIYIYVYMRHGTDGEGNNWRVTYRFSYAMHHNIANKTTPSHPTPCDMRHSQNFSKVDSLLEL